MFIHLIIMNLKTNYLVSGDNKEIYIYIYEKNQI